MKFIITNLRYFIVCGLVFCISCKEQKSTSYHPVLKVDLKEQPVSVFDIFNNVEIIHLETLEESLFSNINKIEFFENTIYIFSEGIDAVLMFDLDGRYVNKIQKIGRGPGEYIEVYDFVLHTDDKAVSMLNPWGSVLTYDFDGDFIKESNLPHPPHAYGQFEVLDNDTYVTWSFVSDGVTGVNLIDTKTLEIRKGFFPDTRIWGGHTWGSTFHKYDNDVYYHESMANKVYRFTSDGHETAYEWDTGIRIIDQNVLTDPYYTTGEGTDILWEKDESGEIPFVFGLQLQSQTHYYAMLKVRAKISKHLFYEKKTGKSMFFEKTSEGIDLNLIHMGDDYAIGLIKTDTDTKGLQNVVSAKDVELLRNRTEDDNWWLVKYTFR